MTRETLWEWYQTMALQYHFYVHSRLPIETCQTDTCELYRRRSVLWQEWLFTQQEGVHDQKTGE
jgi:hypothetical protein